jgi:membrane protease YdiL (CAAX protease family)
LRLKRQLNQIESIARYRLGSPERKATSRISPTTGVITALVVLSMLFTSTNLAVRCLANMEDVLGSVHLQTEERALPRGDRGDHLAQRDSQASPHRLSPASGGTLADGVFQGAVLEATLLLVAVLLLTAASREIARPEWDLEWLVTLPLPQSTLIMSRLVERAIRNSSGFVMLAPFLSVLAWTCGYRWIAPLLGIGFTSVLMFIVATSQTLVDTGLRLALAPPKLRNLQAVFSLVSMLPILLAMSMAMSANSFLFDWASALPAWVTWLPTGLAVRALAAIDPVTAALWSSVMLAEIAIVVAVGFALLQRQMRNGVVAAGVREAVARLPSGERPAALDAPTNRRGRLSIMQRRELRLLGRDRNFLVQTLLLPAVIVGSQVFLNASSNVFVGAVDRPANLAAIAFGLAAYTLMFSAFQTLNAEGQALWILYCFPHSLESLLREKAKLWATAAAIYPATVLAIAIVFAGDVSLQFARSAAIVMLGVPIFAVIATALGVFACDPLAQDPQRRLGVTHVYLYMMLTSFYAYAVYAGSLWQQAALIILTALVAVALWQKARDRFDFLLDPSASPPSRVSVSDGLIAALIFFVLQALVVLAQMGVEAVVTSNMMWISFCVAGAATYGIVRLVYWRSRTADVPRMLNGRVALALLWGVIGGAAAALAGLTYLHIVVVMDAFPALRQASPLTDSAAPWWLAAVAIVAAPIFEEFIFRGLIFRGLERSFGLGIAAVASAAIFAIVHPPLAVIPVFCMGVCAALVYQHAKMLLAPITVHATYNAILLALQWSLVQR